MNRTIGNISLLNHILLYTLYELGVFAALWQHGDPFITTILLVAVPVLAFGVYIPEKYTILRSVLQKIMIICAVAWGVYRFRQNTSFDLNLVESFAILGLGFSFSISKKEYGMMMGIAIILSGYGAIIPPRILYFFLIIPIFIIALFVLYNTRTSSFSRGATDLKISGISLANIWIYVGHFCLVMFLWALIFPFIPTTDLAFNGLNEVSFNTENDTIKDFAEWYTPTKFKKSENSSYVIDGKSPNIMSKNAKNIVEADTDLSMNAFGNGSGAGSPGERLVMKVKSPVKLYWLAQLYDRYNGRKWISTKKMQNQKILPKFFNNGHYKAIPQAFSIKQFISPKLYSGFLVKNLEFGAGSSYKIDQRYYKLVLKKKAFYPATPFRYTVKSILPADEEIEKNIPSLNHWFENIKPEHYLKLPQKAISKRLRKLAKKLTKKWKTPLEKAYAIRHFLRTKFKYNLYSIVPPKNKEAVDFFLFDLKEGHCEYFAASFAVLARLSQLPTRVATGFSPGNFNVLDGTFEVYEYHAHAWAQVFISGKGWLTMDPVPPGQMNIKTTPGFIGSMKDPFSDEWSVKAPELAKEVKEFNDSGMNPQRRNGSSVLTKIAMNIPISRKEFNTSINNIGKQEKLDFFQHKKKTFSFKKLWEDIQNSFTIFIGNIWSTFLNIKTSKILLMISYITIIILGIIFYPIINKRLDFNHKMQNSQLEFEYAMQFQIKNPNQCILHCYATINNLLDLCKMNKPANVDLEKYSNSLSQFSKELQQNVKPVFELYSLLHYGAEDITVIDSHEALICTKESRNILLKYIDQKKKV